jgi:hypothetical protein
LIWPGTLLDDTRGKVRGEILFSSAVPSRGFALLLSDKSNGNDWQGRQVAPRIAVGRTSLFEGIIYSERFSSISGEVRGNISTDGFYIFSGPTAYLNWLVDARISADSALFGRSIPAIFYSERGYAQSYSY